VQDYYRLLGVSPLASRREIARAYRQRAISHHRNRVIQLEDQLALMREAFQTLSDAEARRSYDAKLERQLAPAHQSEDERLRREGRLRAEIIREIGRSSERQSELAVAQNADRMRALADEHDLRQESEGRARRRGELWRLGLRLVVLCALTALAWYFLGQAAP